MGRVLFWQRALLSVRRGCGRILLEPLGTGQSWRSDPSGRSSYDVRDHLRRVGALLALCGRAPAASGSEATLQMGEMNIWILSFTPLFFLQLLKETVTDPRVAPLRPETASLAARRVLLTTYLRRCVKV